MFDPTAFTMAALTRETLSTHVDALVALDREALEAGWTSREFLLDLPGKWEVSRLALAGNGRVAGFLVASIKPPGIHVHRLVVAGEFRGGGLGRELLRRVAADAGTHGVSTVTLKVAPPNEDALRFYKNLGFQESGRDSKNVALTTSVSTLLATGRAP
ncbi:MAG: GNAT family N-acetyltransferase [Thermoanaerobaculia bacterium]